jgi:hypothetical protein
MAVTADQIDRLSKGCIHDEDVRIALAGWLVARFETLGVSIDPEIFTMALDDFAFAMGNPILLQRSLAALEQLKRARAKGMH